jgi:hypothetical protein
MKMLGTAIEDQGAGAFAAGSEPIEGRKQPYILDSFYLFPFITAFFDKRLLSQLARLSIIHPSPYWKLWYGLSVPPKLNREKW